MPLSTLSRVLGWPDGVVDTIGGESTLCLLARMLRPFRDGLPRNEKQPAEPWETWIHHNPDGIDTYTRPVVWHLRRAMGILLGFGHLVGSVLEAIRMPARLRGDEESVDL